MREDELDPMTSLPHSMNDTLGLCLEALKPMYREGLVRCIGEKSPCKDGNFQQVYSCKGEDCEEAGLRGSKRFSRSQVKTPSELNSMQQFSAPGRPAEAKAKLSTRRGSSSAQV